MTKKILLGVALLSVALLGSHVAAGGNDAQREVQDRAQIEKLMWQYVRALDTENADAYAATYTPDGQFGSGATATQGREALKKMIMGLRQRNLDAEARSEERRVGKERRLRWSV